MTGLTGDVVTVCAILAGTPLGAALAESAECAGVLAGDALVARSTRVLARHMVAAAVPFGKQHWSLQPVLLACMQSHNSLRHQ